MRVAALSQICRPAQHDRALAAQFQRQRHQIVRRRAHDVMGNRGRAREQDVVEGELGELGADFRPAGHDGDFFLVIVLSDGLFHHFGRDLRKFRRLDHAAVAGRENTRQRRRRSGSPGKFHGLITPTTPLGWYWICARDPQQAEREFHLPLLRAHPFGDMLLCVLQRADGAGDIGKSRLVFRTVAEILAHRVDQFVIIGDQQVDGLVDPFDPLRRRRIPSRI